MPLTARRTGQYGFVFSKGRCLLKPSLMYFTTQNAVKRKQIIKKYPFKPRASNLLGERGANALICITGDLHGDFNRLCTPELKKLKSRDVLIVCGDFGFVWDGSKEEQKILKKIGKHRYDTLFVEGCHDNYDLLKEYPVVAYKGGKARKISGNLYQLMRGEIYEIDCRSVFAF